MSACLERPPPLRWPLRPAPMSYAVHDVRAMLDVIAVADAVVRAPPRAGAA